MKEEPPPLVLVGAGGHAKAVIEVVRAEGRFALAGLVASGPAPARLLGAPVLGGEEVLPRLRAEGIAWAFAAVGDNAARERIGARLLAMGFRLATPAHPSAVLAASALVGEGAVVMARAAVGADARVAGLAIVNTAAVVEHDGFVGAAAHVAPGAVLAGGVRVGARALVGVGTAVRPGVLVGEDAVVGAGAAVVADVPAGATVAGVPARPLRRSSGADARPQ